MFGFVLNCPPLVSLAGLHFSDNGVGHFLRSNCGRVIAIRLEIVCNVLAFTDDFRDCALDAFGGFLLTEVDAA